MGRSEYNNLIKFNTIAFNGANGISMVSGVNNPILSNSIYSNIGLGIDLFSLNSEGILSSGTTLNDALDADLGNNNLQNYPVLEVFYSGTYTGISATTVSGSLNSAPNTEFNIQFFSISDPDLNGAEEGEIYLGEGNCYY